MANPDVQTDPTRTTVRYDRQPEHYAHWKLGVDGHVATLSMDVSEDGGLAPGYKLKLTHTISASTSNSTMPCSAFASNTRR